MTRLLILLTATVFLTACQTTGKKLNVSGGVGYSEQTPKDSTVDYIGDNDPKFARQVATHNRQCKGDKGCTKAKGEAQ